MSVKFLALFLSPAITEINMRVFKFLASFVLVLLSCGCSSNRSSPMDFESLNIEQEKLMTRELSQQIYKDLPALQNPIVQQFVSGLGDKIVKANKLHENPYTYKFIVVDSAVSNAFALPAGKILITNALLNNVDTEAELAGIIGHEIAHVYRKHTSKQLMLLKQEQSKSWRYSSGGALLGGISSLGLSQLFCRQSQSCTEWLLSFGVVSGAQGGLILQKYLFLSQTKANELEADALGVKLAYNAGYSKDYLANFYLKNLSINNDMGNSDANFEKNHPSQRVRIKNINKALNDLPSKQQDLVNSRDFKKMKVSLSQP